MYLVGLTGGIASGKSYVAKLLEGHGAGTVDADQVAREVVVPGSFGLGRIVELFGQFVLQESGELDRQKLATIIFADPKKRINLEHVLHPLIKIRTRELLARQNTPVVVYSVPLLVEARVDYPFDAVVTVEAGTEIQKTRLMASRGLTAEEASRRLDAQATAAERLASSQHVIDSSGTKQHTALQVAKLWDEIVDAATRKAKSGAN